MENIQKKSNIQSTKQYPQKKIIQDSKVLLSNENQFQNIPPKNKEQKQIPGIKKSFNPNLNFLGQVPTNYYNEVMASELNNLSRENSELKFCLEKLNKKFEK